MRTVVMCLVALSGIAVGHAVAYEIAAHDELERVVPHGHLPLLAVVATLALVALVVLATVAESRGRPLPLSLWRLAGIQLVGFAALEAAERAAASSASAALLAEPVFWTGLVSQVAAAILLRWGVCGVPRLVVSALRRLGPGAGRVPAGAPCTAAPAVPACRSTPLTARVPRAPPVPTADGWCAAAAAARLG